MKRAVTIDASARGSPHAPQFSRLKRCKSAFVNLKRLGGAVTASPKMRPLPGRFPGDSGSVSWALGEEINQSSRWWQQQPSSATLSISPAWTPQPAGVIADGGPGRSFTIGSRCATTSSSSSMSSYRSSSAFSPHGGSTSLRGAGRRLFVASGNENTQDGPRRKGSSGGGAGADGGSSYRGRSARMVGSRRNTIFSSAFSFSPVLEKGAISSTGDDGRLESSRCCPLQLRGHRQPLAGASRIAGSALIDFDLDTGCDVPIEGDVEDHVGGCWTGPGSPALSAVGFDLTEDEEDEARGGDACSSAPSLSPNTVESQPATTPAGNASRHEGFAEVADEHAIERVEAWSPSWSQTCQTSIDSKRHFTVGNTPSGDDSASPILLLRLQRRFEEMVLVSNVAT